MIREAASADLDAWLPLWRGYNEFYARPALPDDITRTTWARLLDPTEPMHALLAEHAGTVVGLAHFIFHRSTTAITNTCYLQDLFVAPPARGRGIARALIEAVHARAAAAGAKRVYWQTHESNVTAQRLYDRIAERSGFIVYRMPIA